jgi:hypothetical protein
MSSNWTIRCALGTVTSPNHLMEGLLRVSQRLKHQVDQPRNDAFPRLSTIDVVAKFGQRSALENRLLVNYYL